MGTERNTGEAEGKKKLQLASSPVDIGNKLQTDVTRYLKSASCSNFQQLSKRTLMLTAPFRFPPRVFTSSSGKTAERREGTTYIY